MTAAAIWLRRNVKWLFPFAGAVAMGLKPWLLGQHYGSPEWLAFASLVAAAGLTWLVPNVESGLGQYVKALLVVSLAGLGAAQQALPGGISRADLWTVGVAVVSAAGTFLFRTTATQAVQSGGPGKLGDSLPSLALAAPPPQVVSALPDATAPLDPSITPIPNTKG